MVYERRVRSCRSASRTSPNSAPRVEITADEITRHPRWATSPLSEVQINCEQHSRSPGAQCPEASLATRLRYSASCTWSSTPTVLITPWSYGCINLRSARRAHPLGLTPPGVFLAIAEGRLTAASFSLTTDQRFQIALLADRPLRR